MTSPLPNLTPLDKQRFNAWFEHDSRLPDLAEELDTTVLELAEWARQPHIAERLEAVATISRQRHATLRAEAQHAATARLLRIVRFCDHDEIARRAADRLLRSLPAGERPLYDEPEHLTDKGVHSPQSTHRLQATPSLRPLRAPAVPAPSDLPVERCRATTPTSSPIPTPSDKRNAPPASSKPTRDELVTVVLDAADRSGVDPDALDVPGFLEDLIVELNACKEIDIDDLRKALKDAQADRNAGPVRVKAPP